MSPRGWRAISCSPVDRPWPTPVNNLEIARAGWRELAADCGAELQFVEVVCLDIGRVWESLANHHLVTENIGDPAQRVAEIVSWVG